MTDQRFFIILLATSVAGVLAFDLYLKHKASAAPVDVTVPDAPTYEPQADNLGSGGGLTYLTANSPGFNPGPPVFNVMPRIAAAVSTVNSGCNSCGG